MQDSWFVECADYLFLNWFARCYLWLNVWLKLTMDDFVCVFDAWRKWSCGVVCVWTRTNSDTIVSMLIWFCYLGRMIYGGKLIWCDLLASKNIPSRRNSFGLSLHFRQQKKQIPLKKMIIRPRAKLSIVSRMLRVSNIQW